MEAPWSKICMKWVELLKLSPSSNIISLTDGKFFLSFMKRYLNFDRQCYIASETFGAVHTLLRNEFSSDLVNLSDAQQGNEEELVKTITLFMYLTVVKYEQFGPKSCLDDAQFTEEVKFHTKCILKALLEQHAVLTPSLLTEIIIGSKLSSGTGQMSAGNVTKLRCVSRIGVGSPAVFTSSPSHESPLKEFLDSPTVRQVTKYQRIVKERDRQIGELRSKLEIEKMEKQVIMEELEHLRQGKESADIEVLTLKREMRKRSSASDLDVYCDYDSTDLSEKFHSLLKDKKDSDKYLALVEKQLEESMRENEEMQTRLDALAGKLNAAKDEKREIDVALVEMQANLGSSNAENGKLKEVTQALRQELDDFNQQLLHKSLPRKAISAVASFYLETMDMGNVSVDADESCYTPSIDVASVAGENMMDVVERRLEEKVERLVMELGAEKEARAWDREATNVRIAELEVESKEKQKRVDACKERIGQLEERLDFERGENKCLKEEVKEVYVDKELISAMLQDTKMDLNKHVVDNIGKSVELKNGQLAKSLLEEKVRLMEKDALVLKTQLAKEVEVKEGLKESLYVQKQNFDHKQNEVESLIQNLSSVSMKLKEAEEKENGIIASLEVKSSSNEHLLVENKRMSEEKYNMKVEVKHLNEENSNLKLKLDQLNKELNGRDQDDLGNLQYLQSELKNKKRDLWWEQMKSANLEQSMTNQDIKTALKAQKERYQKKHKEILTEVMEKNVQKIEELKNMCIQKNESLEQEIIKLKKENKIVLAKHDDSKLKLASVMENVATIKAAYKEELGVLEQKLNDAKEKIRKFKMENDLIIVQLDVAKEKYKDLAHIIEASKMRKTFASNLPSRKTSLPDFKEEDDVFETTSVSGGRTASDGQTAPDMNLRPPSGSGSFFHFDEGNAEGRISELARRNSMCLPHLKSSYPVESQFLPRKFTTEDEIRQSNIKLQQPENLHGIKDAPHHDSCMANMGGQSTSKHPGRAKRQFSEAYECFEKEGLTKFLDQPNIATTNMSNPSYPQPPLQTKPKMPELLCLSPINYAKRKYEEKRLKESSQDSGDWMKRRKYFWSKTKVHEGESSLHNV